MKRIGYSDIIKIIERDNILLLFISERTAYLMPSEPEYNGNSGFERFITEKTGIIPARMITSKKHRRKDKKS